MDTTADSLTLDADRTPEVRDRTLRAGDTLDDSTAGLIRQHVDVILGIKSRIAACNADIQAEYAVAKSEGLDKGALSELVRRMLADPDELAEMRLVVALYETAYHSAELQDGGGHV
jgi:uncharacterized protein (UPF0335 family)